jgi:outer membrane protein OmpA-like peptidoglycan-associated protein
MTRFMSTGFNKSARLMLILTAFVAAAWAQGDQGLYPANPNPAPVPDAQQGDVTQTVGPNDMPVFRVTVSARTTKAVNYRDLKGSTEVNFKGTDLEPDVEGHAKVEGKAGRMAIHVEIAHLVPANRFGGQFLTYVLWAITPEGRAVNLGEVLPGKDNKEKNLDVTTDLQSFGLIITAEPYYAVTHPSDKVVAENVVKSGTKGYEAPIDAKFDVLEGGQYTIDVQADKLPSSVANIDAPQELLEARNAVVIAKAAGARQYAPDTLTKAEDMLQRAEDAYRRKQSRQVIGTSARGATQMAEDARVLTLRRAEQARIDADRRAHEAAQAAAEASAAASQQAAAQAQQQSQEDAQRRADAEAAQAAALAQQQQAQAAAAAAQQAQQQAEQQTQLAEQQRQEAIQQKEAMRARLLAQLNQVLQTRDTAKGLIVSMPDVLFAFNKYELKPEARERLARISGIVLAYPDLKLEIDGYTDSIGSDEYNQTLSDKRAESVRDYLVSSGVNMNSVVARGMGKADPVADNGTSEGRQLNRRVEMIVSGDVIGNITGQGAPQ